MTEPATELRDRICGMVDAGMSLAAIADATGLRPGTVRAHCRKAGRPTPREARRQRIVALHRSGMCAKRIAYEAGLTANGVCWQLRAAGLSTRGTKGRDMAAAFLAGASIPELARERGIGIGGVRSHLRRFGLGAKDRGREADR